MNNLHLRNNYLKENGRLCIFMTSVHKMYVCLLGRERDAGEAPLPVLPAVCDNLTRCPCMSPPGHWLILLLALRHTASFTKTCQSQVSISQIFLINIFACFSMCTRP
jgi:hypothetical protein